MGRFDEKIMLVTGATSGIGRAVAIRAAKEGATVVAVGRNEERGAAVVAAMEEAGGKVPHHLHRGRSGRRGLGGLAADDPRAGRQGTAGG